MRVLVIDNYDSFTYNLVQYLGELGAEPDVVRNDRASVEELLARGADRVVISPGPCRPVDAGVSIEAARRFPEEGIPVLGVCLGAQMLARSAGAGVRPAAEPEIGWYEIALTSEGSSDPVLGALPTRATVFQWHHYTFDLPQRGVELARSEVCTQAFRVDGRPAWGIQFHAEVTYPMLSAWVDEDSNELPMAPTELLAESKAVIGRSNAQGRWLADAFLREASS